MSEEKRDTKTFVDDIMQTRSPMTKERCHEYYELGGEDMFLGYKDGVYGSTAALQTMLETTSNYEEPKTELSNFITRQKDLLVYMYDTWPGGSVEEFKKTLKGFNVSGRDPSTSLKSSEPSSP